MVCRFTTTTYPCISTNYDISNFVGREFYTFNTSYSLIWEFNFYILCVKESYINTVATIAHAGHHSDGVKNECSHVQCESLRCVDPQYPPGLCCGICPTGIEQ